MHAGKHKEKNMIKARLIILAQMFYTKTDEENQMTNQQILEYLTEHGVPANEKTLRSDITLMQDLGIDIVKVVGRPNRYFWGERQFQMPELKLLIDAVSASRFITMKKSRELVSKLCSLASEHQRQTLRRNIHAIDRVKSDNEEIYYMVDTINNAINMRKQITFQYNEVSPELKFILRNGGEKYYLSPYALMWNEDHYYVIGWSDKHENVSAFRVDRMVRPEITDKNAVKRPVNFNIDDYSKPVFDMYRGKERVEVSLECRNDLAKYIADRFGSRLPTETISDDRFVVKVEVSLSPTFYAWVFQFGGEIRIISPAKAVNGIENMARQILEAEAK